MRLTFRLHWLLLAMAILGWFLAVALRPRWAVIVLDLFLALWIVNSKLGISKRFGWSPPRTPYFLGVGLLAVAIFLTTLLFPGLRIDPL